MKHWFIILMILLFAEPVLAQNISISASKNMAGSTPHFDILGKSSIGAMVHKYGDEEHILEAYNDRMEMKWSKELPLPSDDCYVLHLTLYPKELSYFYLKPGESNQSILIYRVVSADLSQNISTTTIDTFTKPVNKISENLNIQESSNKKYFMTTRKDEKKDNLRKAEVSVSDDEGRVVHQHTWDVEKKASFQYLKWGSVDNNGNGYLAIERDFKERELDGRQDYYVIQRFRTGKSQTKKIKIRFKRALFNDPTFQIDEANKQLTAASFYKSGRDAEPASGYMFWSYNLAEEQTTIEKYHPFKKSMVYRITGKDTNKHDNVLYTFKVKDFINRYDGGAIIVAESNFDNTENHKSSSYVPSASPSFQSVKIHYYNDIIVFSINPDGKRDWHATLRKKQVSEDDDGFYSSYCMLTTGKKLHFIYNEEIFKKTNINEYTVTPEGKVNRKNLFNAGNENIMLMPKLAKQISSNEIIIPSYQKNKVSFVKFTY